MKSKTSFFSPALFRDNLRRYWPMWLLYLLVWGLALLPALWSYSGMNLSVEELEGYIRRSILGSLRFGVIIAAVGGCLAAMTMFSHLYAVRAQSMYRALPIRESGLYVTHYLSGLVWPLAAHVLLFLVGAVMELTMAPSFLGYLAQWLAASSMQYVFFYSLAVFCATLVGQLPALPVLYGAVNVCVPVLRSAVQQICSMFLFGYSPGEGRLAAWLFPIRKLLNAAQTYYPNGYQVDDYIYTSGAYFSTNVNYSPAESVTDVYLYGWTTFLLYALAGALLALLALLVYRHRRAETAGDVLALPVLNRIFPYALAAVGALLGGGVFYRIFIWDSLSSPFAGPLVCLLLGGVFGYYISRALLHKTFAVFRGSLRQMAVICGCILVLALGLRLDVTGYGRNVPDGDKVVSVSLSNWYEDQLPQEEAENIAAALALHQELVDKRDEYRTYFASTPREDMDYTELALVYELAGGGTLQRVYRVPLRAEEETVIADAEAVLNSDEAAAYRVVDLDRQQLSECYIYYYTAEGEWENLWLTSEQALELYQDCILPDLEDKTIGQTRLWQNEDYQSSTYYCDINMSFRELVTDGDGTYEFYTYLYYMPGADSMRTSAYLEDLGVELVDLKTVYALWEWE